MGGHSIDFVQDSRRRRRRRRGQPDPPLVVPTRLQHRPPPHIPPRLVSYSFSFEPLPPDPSTTPCLRVRMLSLSFSLSLPFLSRSSVFSLCPILSSCILVHVRALDKMPRKFRARGTAASSTCFIGMHRDQTNRLLKHESWPNHENNMTLITHVNQKFLF